MPRRIIRAFAIAVALTALSLELSGCALLLTGYLVGDGIAKSERVKA
jgi:hypothetical protein